jgi:deoxyribodipyrimidine photo-lyase
MMTSSKEPLTIFWFRRDLRIEDNIGLAAALATEVPVHPIFIFDPDILTKLKDRDDARVSFLRDLVRALDEDLRTHGSALDVYFGKPFEIFQKLISHHKIAAVYANHDYEPYAIQRDEQIDLLLAENGIAFHTYKDQVIFEKDEVVKLDQTPYSVYSAYAKKWLDTLDLRDLKPARANTDHFVKRKTNNVPSLTHLGFEAPSLALPSVSPMIDLHLIRKYSETRDLPAVAGTSHLGAHLRFGRVSIRHLVKIAEKENKTFLSELIWREFFAQILWHYPHVVKEPFRPEYGKIEYRHDIKDFHKWTEGKTGYPLVDAGMRELNETGFMHNRVRMVTASFLVKHLLIDWREGENYFARKLFDFELASNNGNWQWVAGSGCDAAPYFRVFNPTLQQKRFDPQFVYIKKWIPEFGTSKYPEPMVDHNDSRERVIKAYKSALSRRGPVAPLKWERRPAKS